MSDFYTWWNQEGSAIRPDENEDHEEFAKRVAQTAWDYVAHYEREECAKLAEEVLHNAAIYSYACAAAIRSRGEVK